MGKALSRLILVLVAVPAGCKADHDFVSGLRGSVKKYIFGFGY
jgi:hypothetical protein